MSFSRPSPDGLGAPASPGTHPGPPIPRPSVRREQPADGNEPLEVRRDSYCKAGRQKKVPRTESPVACGARRAGPRERRSSARAAPQAEAPAHSASLARRTPAEAPQGHDIAIMPAVALEAQRHCFVRERFGQRAARLFEHAASRRVEALTPLPHNAKRWRPAFCSSP